LGCGTGEHARFLAAHGFAVVGVDASESMLEKAREEPLPPGLDFVLGRMQEVDRVTEGSFGGAICLGNALPHLLADEDLESLATGLRRRLLPGAPFLLQVLNYGRIFAKGERHLPLSFRPDPDGDLVFLRLIEPQADGTVLFFPSTLRLRPGHEPPLELMATREVKLRGWRREEIERTLDAAGFHRREVYGSFEKDPFDELESRDVILVAR
jgi:SAM-dependent methyltransferase